MTTATEMAPRTKSCKTNTVTGFHIIMLFPHLLSKRPKAKAAPEEMAGRRMLKKNRRGHQLVTIPKYLLKCFTEAPNSSRPGGALWVATPLTQDYKCTRVHLKWFHTCSLLLKTMGKTICITPSGQIKLLLFPSLSEGN